MKAGEIYAKTLPFVWAKLLLGLITVLAAAILFAVLMGLGWLFNSESVTMIMFLIWLGAIGGIRTLLMHYIGYLLQAGHIAVIAEAATTGFVPDNQVNYGKRMVSERFLTANVYFAVDKLVSGAVKQIQKSIGKLGSALDFIPGMGTITGLAQFFIDLSLGYIDECCLGYTFYQREQGAFKSAADGVVIYAQNAKKLLGSAAKTMVMVTLSMVAITLGLFIVLALVFRLFNGPGFVAFILSLLIALAIKSSFIDSFILTQMMVAYMEEAPTTVISFDLYGNLCSLSSQFKELWNKGQQEEVSTAASSQMQPAYAPATPRPQSIAVGAPLQAVPAPEIATEKPVFCGQCGASNKRSDRFCGSCGAAMQP